MFSVNKVIMIGHVAAEPEIRETKNGKLVANFPLATDRLGGNGEGPSVTDYHKVVAWGRQAEVCQQYLAKGMAVYVEGRVHNRTFELPDGTKRFATEIVLQTLNLLTSKKAQGIDHIGLQELDPASAE